MATLSHTQQLMETLAEDLLSIPPDIQDHILPRRTLSVAEFLKFPLPPPTPRHTVTDVDLYLSSFHPTVTCTDKILDIPIPPTTVLLNLTKSVKTHDTNSILCPHTSELQEEQRLPLWIVDYWTQISAIQPVQQKWKCAAKNLQELENVEDKEHSGNRKTLSEIRDMLHWIGWAEKINGFPASISTVFLTPYFTKQWLTDEQENQMLHLLEKDVRADISNNYIEVLPTYFTESLTAAYQSPETYPTDPPKAWIRKKGHDLQSNSGILATLANINGNHWVAVVLDFRSAEIHYGDSMGGSIRKKLEDMLMWWTYQHTGRHFTTSYLPISRQKDGYSCGILSWSALATYVLPTQYTLMKTDQLTMERLKMFLVVTKHHISESVVADTEGSEHAFLNTESAESDGEIEILPRDPKKPAHNQCPTTDPEPATALLVEPAPPPTLLQSSSSSQGFRKSHVITDYFKRGTQKDVKEYWQRVEEEAAVRKSEEDAMERDYAATKKQKEREMVRERVQKHRAKKKEEDIKNGTRNPDGTKVKQKISEVELVDDSADSMLKRIKGNVAEITRHERHTKEILKQKTKRPQGRKPKPENAARPATYHDWLTPLCWSHISIVAKQVGPRMSSTDIVRVLKQRDPVIFEKLSRSTVDGWIDRSGEVLCWKKEVRLRVESGKGPGHDKGGARGILSAHPEVVETIKSRLLFLRERGSPISLITARATLVSTILHMKPEILEIKFKDGTSFRASDAFMRKFLHSAMAWSLRKGTHVAQKMPKNWEDICEKSFFCKAFIIKENDIPVDLYVNSDQTQVVYAPGNRMTWTPAGTSQVAIVGIEEKRAFTLMVSVCANGTLLPFQAIYVGLTKVSLPAPTATNYDDCIKAGFLFEVSGTKTYWSNQSTMRNFVNKILAPYFDKKKEELGLPSTQKSLWQIDVWSVHRSEEFRSWMRKMHPTIIIDFIPGGCTGVHQPCDVGIQRPLKLSMRRSYHEDIVSEFLTELDNGNPAPALKDALGVVRNRSVRWMWNTYCAVNNVNLVQKAFEGCVAREWNLSYTCLTAYKAREALRNLKTTDPLFWNELNQQTPPLDLPGPDDKVDEDDVPTAEKCDTLLEDVDADDSDIPIETLIMSMSTPGDEVLPPSIGQRANGTLTSLGDAENRDFTEAVPAEALKASADSQGKRIRRPNQQYKEFWKH
ncbi:hypothetical protein D9613_012075 [Agrocybe pediades]|uniref:Ubiquitin-like protease family profile domain-containing protein n=1 Tax=Agrocybe pediades TaxID=84607 RepID=A0A8H4VTF6_9AGAR|nr:hypothetical protein D9613_012075 [Agrocybe pediades]